MTFLKAFINIAIIFNVGFWSSYLITNIFLNINKLDFLIYYLIIGLIVGFLTTKDKKLSSNPIKRWSQLMGKLNQKNKLPRFMVIFVRAISWPLGLVITSYKFIKRKV